MVGRRIHRNILGIPYAKRRKKVKIAIFEHEAIRPLERFGLTSSFWDIHIGTLIYTWIAMGFLLALVIAARFYYRNKTVNPFSYALEQVIDFFVDLSKESFGHFKYNWFVFIMSIFTFTLACNLVGLLPFVTEATEDINTALACGISSFVYIQYQKIKVEGFVAYIKEYCHPIFILFPLNVIGELAKVASMSFRLFGNILGGSIIVTIALQSTQAYWLHFTIYTIIMLPIILIFAKKVDPATQPKLNAFFQINNLIIFSGAWLLMFFGLFEGVIQSFVITMLTVTYLSLISKEEPA